MTRPSISPVSRVPALRMGRGAAIATFFASAHIAVASDSGEAQRALFAARSIPAGVVLEETDLVLDARTAPGAVTSLADAVGRETRIAIYAGAPVLAANLQAPALVERNQLVEMRFSRGGLTIRTEGRALDRGAAGERVRVMNLSSRSIVSGLVEPTGAVTVGRRN